MGTAEKTVHIVPYRTYFIVWGALILLTGILVSASRFGEVLSIWAMLLLTPVKAGLVFFFFMHLKYESTALKALVFMTLGILLMIIALFFLDISYR